MIRKKVTKLFKIGSWSLLIFGSVVLLLPLPSPLFSSEHSTILSDSEGILLSAQIAPDGQWRFPESDSIPEKYEILVLLFEDEYFYKHPGINPWSLVRAAYQNYMAGQVISGGSTITMQLVRMARGNKPRTVWQKSYETLLSIKLDLFYSKQKLLNLYASHAPFGGNVVGLETASWRYFGRPSFELSWSESATLAVLPNSPSLIFPGRNHDILKWKRDQLLTKLAARGYLTDSDLRLAQDEQLPGRPKPMPELASHLLARAVSEGQGGKAIRTTLNSRLQSQVGQILNRHSSNLRANQIHNAAAIVLDVESGNVLSYIGNSQTDGEHGQYVDVITSRRSPGSLLKPILYASALDDGLIMPSELLPDIPIFYNGFAPKNFDKKYRGAVPADEALSRSLNVPFVNLLQMYGYEKFHHQLKRMGVRSLDKPAGHYGLSLILGGGDVTLWEMSSVYASMARTLNEYYKRPVGRQYNSDDYHLAAYEESIKPNGDGEQTGLLRAESIYHAFKAMQNLNRPDSQVGWQRFNSAYKISWKTGTSFGHRDGWAVGVTPEYVVGVWVGNADGEGRPGLTGISAAAPLMFDIFELFENDKRFQMPQEWVETVEVCVESGMRASTFCSNTSIEILGGYLIAGRICEYHTQLNLDSNGVSQVTSECYEVGAMKLSNWFVLPPIQSWYYKQYHPEYQEPPEFANGCTSNSQEKLITLIYPRKYTRVFVPMELDGKPGRVIFEATHRNNEEIIYWHIDDQYMGQTFGQHQMGFYPEKGSHIVSLVDSRGNEAHQRFEVVSDGD